MAIFRPSIYEHNNPNLAFVDSDFVGGGFRTAVVNLVDLYALSDKIGLPSAKGQLKERSTVVYVENENKYYILVDVNNVDKASGWEVFGGNSSISKFTDLADTPNDYQDGKLLMSSGSSIIYVDVPEPTPVNVLDNVVITDVNYTMLGTDDYIGVNGAEIITLMELPEEGKKVCVTDISGEAETNNITINSNSSTDYEINGNYSAIINTNYGSITMIFIGDKRWSIIGFVN